MRDLILERRRLARRRKKNKTNQKLHSLALSRPQSRWSPTTLDMGGKLTANRQDWIDGAVSFGLSRFQDSSNSAKDQQLRLEKICSASRLEMLNGRRAPKMEFWHVLQARGSLKLGTAVGRDENPPEIWKAIPFVLVLHLWKLFSKRAESPSYYEGIPTWRILDFIGIPKLRHARAYTDFRWIAKIDVLQKWYLRSLRPQFQSQLRVSDDNRAGGWSDSATFALIVGLGIAVICCESGHTNCI